MDKEVVKILYEDGSLKEETVYFENQELEEGIIKETIHRFRDKDGRISEDIRRFVKEDGRIKMIDIQKSPSGDTIINNYGVANEEELMLGVNRCFLMLSQRRKKSVGL